MNTLLYCRTSTKGIEGDRSLSRQEEEGRAYATRHDLHLAQVIRDRTDGSSQERAGLGRIRETVAQGEIQAIIASTPDRLSRRSAHLEALGAVFTSKGIELHFITS